MKNLLLFVPLLAAHLATDFNALLAVIFAFISFSLCASAVYILNDLLDLENDRKHDRKRYRPLAASQISIPSGIKIFFLLLLASFALSFSVNDMFVILVFSYLVTATFYSLWLKRFVLIVVLHCLLFYFANYWRGVLLHRYPYHIGF